MENVFEKMNRQKKYPKDHNYELLSKFESLEEFNSHFEQAMLLHKDEFTKSQYIALNKLRKFAADIIGVAWCKGQTAVSATHKDDMFGISRSSFDRMLRVAKKLNLITVINQYRKNKYQKHNVYVFNRLEELTPGALKKPNEVVEIVSKSHTIDVSDGLKIDSPKAIILKLPEIKDNTNITKKPASQENECKQDLNKKALLEKIPNVLHGLGLYTDDSDMIYKLVSTMLAAKKKVSSEIKFEEHPELFRKVIRSVYEYWNRQVRKGNESYNVFGLMYKAVKELCERIADGSVYQVSQTVSKAPQRKIENVPTWMADKAKVFEAGRSEMLPEWFATRNDDVQPEAANVVAIDFEAERQKILAKLG